MGTNTVESVNDFIYLGSKISSDGRSTPEVMRRIALAASAMNQLGRVWKQSHLLLTTKLRLYESCVLSILLYCSETWTLLKADIDHLQASYWYIIVKSEGDDPKLTIRSDNNLVSF